MNGGKRKREKKQIRRYGTVMEEKERKGGVKEYEKNGMIV